MNKQVATKIWCVFIIVLLAVPIMAGQHQRRPKFKLVMNTNFSNHSVRQPDGINWLGDYANDPVPVDYLNDLTNMRHPVNDRYSDYSGQLRLGYNFTGNWYITGGLQYERWDKNKDEVRLIGNWDGVIGQSYFKTTTVIPFVAIEYSSKIWGFNYNSSVGLAECISRADVSYIDITNNRVSLGKYSYNSPGMILSGGLSYELVRNTYISGQLGYRFFDGNSLNPPSGSDSPTIEFDYDGVFYGIGMGFGWGGM